MTPPLDAIAEIKRLYYSTTKQTVARDLERAIELLKSLDGEDERARAAVFMDGLTQMRSEWGVRGPASPGVGAKRTAPPRRRRT
jgi:hypothetical protein